MSFKNPTSKCDLSLHRIMLQESDLLRAGYSFWIANIPFSIIDGKNAINLCNAFFSYCSSICFRNTNSYVMLCWLRSVLDFAVPKHQASRLQAHTYMAMHVCTSS